MLIVTLLQQIKNYLLLTSNGIIQFPINVSIVSHTKQDITLISLDIKKKCKLSIKKCTHCIFFTSDKSQLIKHVKKNHKKTFCCKYCEKYKTILLKNIKQHEMKCKKTRKYSSLLCHECGKKFLNTYYFNQHKHICSSFLKENELQISMRGKFTVYKFNKFSMSNDFQKAFLIEMKDIITHYVSKEANESLGIKWYLTIQVSMYKTSQDDEETWIFPVFTSSLQTQYPYKELNSLMETFNILNEKIELFTRLGSGWVFNELLQMDLYVAQHILYPVQLGYRLQKNCWIYTKH